MEINSCSGTSSSLSVGESTATADEQNATASTSKSASTSTSKLASALNKASSSFISGDTGETKSLKEIGKSVKKEARRFFKRL